MIGDMGIRVREEKIVDVVRVRKKDEGGSIRPIIVEFRTEYDKWTVLRNKSDLREMNEYRRVFRAGCIKGREREEASNDSGKKGRMGAEREDGSKEIGVEECKEDSYKRETDEIGSVDEEK